MAVDAVASVVLQKLLLVDESFASNKIIGRRLKHLKAELKPTNWRSSLGAANEETNAEEIKTWTEEYLDHLYSIEDSIESFALSFTRQSKKLGCLVNHALFLKKFTALKMLDIKLRSIQTKVKKLNSRTTSLESREKSVHQQPEPDDGDDEQEYEEREAGEMIQTSFCSIDEETESRSSSMKRTKSSPSVGNIQERPTNLRKNHSSAIKKRSYNDLDNHLKLCLIYMTLFPKELDIPVRRLQRLWLAEGFVERTKKQGEFQEDVAQKYFEHLVKHSLIMVSKQRSDGSPRRCRLQGALHDLLLEQARDIRLFHVLDHGSNCLIGTRRLVEYSNPGNCPMEPSQIPHVRSYISFTLQKKDTTAKHVGSLVSKMIGKGLGLLRVLDLEGVYKPSLPENLGDLFHLRYLGLRWTYLDRLPKSVGDLPYLQTLDLKSTCIDKIPTSIWKLKNLQHLNLNDVHLDKDTPLHFRRSLPDLLTLWGLSVSHESPITNGLSKLKHLRELGITFRFIKRDDSIAQGRGQPTEALAQWISQLTDLRSLRVQSNDDSGSPSDLSLKPFSSLRKLSHMKLLGKLQQLPPFDHFPPHIKVLTLSLSYLSEDPMPILENLPDFTVLRLLGNSYLGETLVCSSDGFKKLEVLKLWNLEQLEKWEVEHGAMTKLKEVNIRCCSKMKNFPSSLLEQKTFQDLILNNMPPAFKESIDNKYKSKVSIKDFKDNSEARS